MEGAPRRLRFRCRRLGEPALVEGVGRPLDTGRPLLEVGFPARFHQPGVDGADLVLAGGVGPLR